MRVTANEDNRGNPVIKMPWILEHFCRSMYLSTTIFRFLNALSKVILANMAKKGHSKSDKKAQKTGYFNYGITSIVHGSNKTNFHSANPWNIWSW
jgi:hypothetical protein